MKIILVICMFCSITSSLSFAQLQLTRDGKAECVIVVPSDSLAWEGDDRRLNIWGRVLQDPQRDKHEYLKRIQRDSIKDLAHYLGRVTGTDIDIVEGLPENDDRIPIYIGSEAETVFGPVGIGKAGDFGFRVVADQRGVGLYGESEYGTSFAIYELLHDLGCRWYMPSELGEVIPESPTITLAEMDHKLAPATEYRNVWERTGDADFRRRNRLGGWGINAFHTLENYITDEQREAHPEWRLHIDGEPRGRLLRWTREDVAQAVADAVIAQLDERYRDSMSLSPGDYVVPTEDPEERKHDPEPRVWEPAAGRWSVSDRLYMLANRVAERVGEKYPDVRFGLLAYVNYSLPPAREPVHPNIIPVLSPIDFNRQHPMNWPDHPNEFQLLEMVEGWGRVADRIVYRGYGMNLAEITAPNPFITKWSVNIPILLENNMAYWAPETMAGWESMMPGYYLSFRMTFYPDEKPDDILEEMWRLFYGAAAEPMAAYWHLIDRAWIETEEYSGCGFGYLRMFTPEIMEEARRHIDQALAACETVVEYQRVKMIEESLSLFELFMKMREDFSAARLRNLASDLDDWRGSLRHLRRRYRAQFGFDSGLALNYVDNYFGHVYEDASRMEQTRIRLGNPMLEWKYRHNPGPEEDALPWTVPDYDDYDWPTTHVVRETWSAIGHHNTMTDEAAGTSGRMVYRANPSLRALPEDKRAWLWIGSTDGSAKVFVNGKHIPYVVPETTRHHEAGEVLDRFAGYCRPARFDVTDVVQSGRNQITILAERNRLWELGTGGLMGPVVVYRER